MSLFARSPTLDVYIRLLRLDRPVGIYLLLWPPLWALWLAAGDWPESRLLIIIVLGVVVMRSAGCAINDYADRELDAQVARTRERPLASGALPPRAGVQAAAVLFAVALGLALLLPALSLMLAIPAALLAISYPYAKRWHHGPQLHLGFAFAFSVPIAITASTGDWPQLWGWLLFLATVLWVIAYDTLYAMADRDDDLKVGNRSTAILFGRFDLVIIGLLQGAFLGTLWLAGAQLGLGAAYALSLAVVGGLLAWQLYSCRRRESARCLRAFLQNPRVGAVIWVGIVLEVTDATTRMASIL